MDTRNHSILSGFGRLLADDPGPQNATSPPESGLVQGGIQAPNLGLVVVVMMMVVTVMVILRIGWCSHARQQDKSEHSK